MTEPENRDIRVARIVDAGKALGGRIKRRRLTHLEKIWRSRGGGFYALGYLATLAILTAGNAIESFGEFQLSLSGVFVALIRTLISFSIEAMINAVQALLWPLLFFEWFSREIYGLVALASLFLLFLLIRDRLDLKQLLDPLESEREQAESITDFWFGPLESGFNRDERKALWWSGRTEDDQQITTQFGALTEQARDRQLDHWRRHPRCCLALIILVDQFSRQIHRKTAAAFSADSYACEIVKEAISLRVDRELVPIERCFFYLPLVHSESLTDQKEARRRLKKLRSSLPRAQRTRIQSFIDSAQEHQEIIKRFGRFPHRNAVLGREATPEEAKFLANGPRFGQ